MNENGVISFENPWKYAYPELLPTNNDDIQNSFIAAAFWSDNDIRKDGVIRYATYDRANDNNPSGKAVLDQVNKVIQTRQDGENEEPFEGLWMLIAHWDGVHPSPHGGEDHNGISEESLNKVSVE